MIVKTNTAPLPRKCWGLFIRRECWGLSFRGGLVLLLTLFILAVVWLFNIQPFLAPTQRLATRILVVEGWVHTFAIKAAVNDYKQKNNVAT